MPTVTKIYADVDTKKSGKIRCAAYCRVSSSSEDQLNSYAAQIRYYSNLFESSETEELIDIYADEGISGTSADKRDEFNRLIYDCKKGKIDRIYTKSIEVRYEDENIWLTQKMMSVLYDVSVSTINEHIKKIFSDNELDENSVIRKFRITAADGKNYNTNHYNLQVIIAVGFKVNNEWAVQFRKWANTIVKEFTIKGFAMDDERLKNGGSVLTQKYFDQLLERIREIRLSERRFYQKITDIYATAIDYDKNASTTNGFIYRSP